MDYFIIIVIHFKLRMIKIADYSERLSRRFEGLTIFLREKQKFFIINPLVSQITSNFMFNLTQCLICNRKTEIHFKTIFPPSQKSNKSFSNLKAENANEKLLRFRLMTLNEKIPQNFETSKRRLEFSPLSGFHCQW